MILLLRFSLGEMIPASDSGRPSGRQTDATCQNPSGRRIHHGTGCLGSLEYGMHSACLIYYMLINHRIWQLLEVSKGHSRNKSPL